MYKIPLMAPSLRGNEQQYVADVIQSTWIGGVGAYLERFEREWAELCGTKECVAAANGTVSLHLGLLALGAGPGDEVIVPALTYVATANAVRFVGAEPVFVDIDPVTWCLDPTCLEAAITRRTKGIMPVHLHGHPADMDEINKIAALYKLWTLADAAQAHLATYKNRPVGSLADMESFSFHVGKIFTCGEGGAITLNDSKLAKWLRTVRGHGMDPERRFFHPALAYNYRLTNLQASLLCAQLERRDEIMNRRRALFRRYADNLRGTPGIALQQSADWAVTCPWVFCLTVDPDAFGVTRDRLIEVLAEQGIESRRFAIPLHTLPHFREQARTRGDHCPTAEHFSETGMYLPSSTDMSMEQADQVCEVVRSCRERKLRKCAIDLAIQRATPDNEPALAELFATLAGAGEDHYFLPHPLTAEQARRVAHYDGQDLYAVALHQGLAIAYGMLRGWDAGYEAPSLGISVHPEYRGRRIGLALMHYLHAAAALRNCSSIRLRVNRDNQRARKLYQELGYCFEESEGDYQVGYLALKPPPARAVPVPVLNSAPPAPLSGRSGNDPVSWERQHG